MTFDVLKQHEDLLQGHLREQWKDMQTFEMILKSDQVDQENGVKKYGNGIFLKNEKRLNENVASQNLKWN